MDKRQLYEDIMMKLSKVVKEQLNSFFENENKHKDIISKTEQALDDYVYDLADKAKRIISRMTPEQLNKFNSSYDDNSRNFALTRYGIPSMSMLESRHYSNITKDASEVAADLKRIFKLDNFQVSVDDSLELNLPNVLLISERTDFDAISLIISDIDNNFELIDNFMNKSGYTLTRKYTPVYNDGSAMYVLIYTPIKRINVSKELTNKHLFHVSPSSEMMSIKEHGLIPKARYGTDEEGGIIYPERIFFFLSEKDAIELKEYNECFGDSYEIYAVKTEDITSRMEVFYDPLYGKKAVYVEHSVPISLIKKKKRTD